MIEGLDKVLVVGSGPIKIGQAAEFDYSGSQACLSLREEGIKTVLVNCNPATIQTDLDVSDIVYLEPLRSDILEKIIAKERPDGILPTMGGQTGLNLATELYDLGVLEKYGVKVMGTSIESIKKGEGREEFAKLMKKIREPIALSRAVRNLDDALAFVEKTGYPAIIRPGYTLGGTGGGIAFNEHKFREIVERGILKSRNGEVLVEEYVGGWKEIEYEVVRDGKGNCITVCNMENFDPMGIHTGESIVVAPSQTLTDEEYQGLRSSALHIISALGIQGGCNVQYALNPEKFDYKVIEVNPRVSRSSALASKATGYPIARVAAKIAVGYNLDEIRNEVTKETSAMFEPALDYVVVKIPRWPFDKFQGLGRVIGTEMRSTGEVMGIGRRFEEALQKAIRSLDIGFNGICCKKRKPVVDKTKLATLLAKPTDLRLYYIYDALKAGLSVDEIHDITKIDEWFLAKLVNILSIEQTLSAGPLDARLLSQAKRLGFSDMQIGELTETSEDKVRQLRERARINPVFKMVDTCAAEFEAKTPYYYSSYEAESDVKKTVNKKVIILGAGPIRIGQGIEFDYCTVHAIYALRQLGFETIIINNNPETVSTDFDTSDKLYFEPITLEDVLAVVDVEADNLAGVMVQFGGQTAINLTAKLHMAGVRILGTSPDAIDRAEDRGRFGEVLVKLGIPSPSWDTANSFSEAVSNARKLGYPILVRPSYVLGGRAMRIISSEDELKGFVDEAMEASPNQQILLDKFLEDAVEVDVDAVSDGKDVFIGGVMEHIEEAGIHSGDSACVIPPQTLSQKTLDTVVDYTRKIALELKVVGLLNIQYAVKDGVVFVLEANPRASRTVPFVSKATGVPLAKIAAKVSCGVKLSGLVEDVNKLPQLKHVSVKEVVLPFDKLRIDPVLGPEMRSTGESMGVDEDFGLAYYKALLGADMDLPSSGTVFISVAGKDKDKACVIAKSFSSLGFKIVATLGTHKKLLSCGVKSERVLKVSEGSPNILDAIKGGKVDLIVNTASMSQGVRKDGRLIRQAAVSYGLPYVTTITAAKACAEAIAAVKEKRVTVKSINEHISSI